MEHQQQTSPMSSTMAADRIMHQSRLTCPPSAYLFKKHKCNVCDFRSSYRWVVRRHEKRKHKQNSTSDSLTPVDQSVATVQSETDSQINDGGGEGRGVGGGGGGNMSSDETQDQSEQAPPINMVTSTPSINHDDDDNNNNNNNDNFNDNDNNIDNDDISPTQSRPRSPPAPPSSTPQIPTSQKGGVIISNEGTIKRSIEEKEGPFDLRLIEDFKIFCQGPSRSGKTTYVYNLLKHLPQYVKKVPDVIIYVFAQWQEKLDDLQTGKLVDFFIQGNEQIEEKLNELTQNNKSSLIIFDDQINSQTTTEYAARLFSVDARHSGKSCIWITQNLFESGKNGTNVRKIRTNADYIILFKCPGDCLSIQTLSKHITGGPLLYNIHQFVTSRDPYSYLMINITQASNVKLKYTSHTFKKDGVMRVYIPQMK